MGGGVGGVGGGKHWNILPPPHPQKKIWSVNFLFWSSKILVSPQKILYKTLVCSSNHTGYFIDIITYTLGIIQNFLHDLDCFLLQHKGPIFDVIACIHKNINHIQCIDRYSSPTGIYIFTSCHIYIHMLLPIMPIKKKSDQQRTKKVISQDETCL